MNYLFGKKRMKLFELSLISAALIISVSIIRNTSFFSPKAFESSTVTFTLKPGWNLIALPFDGFSAKSLCENYLEILEVDRYDGNTWAKYDCYNPGSDNFAVVPYQGYFVKQEAPEYSASFNGKASKTKMSLNAGWNAWASFTQSQYQTASDLCKIPNKNLKITQVKRWAFGTWNTHTCDQEDNNFPVVVNTVYYVLASNTSDSLPLMMMVTPE